IQRVIAPFRSRVPQYTIEADRVKAETLHLTVDQVFSALAGYLGAAYVDQFNKLARTFQIYVQADARFRLRFEAVNIRSVRNRDGDMIRIGALISFGATAGPSLISLYNL